MKTTKRLSIKLLLSLAALTFACSALAARDDEDDKKKNCKKPKFYDYTPMHLATVAPEAEISFKVARAKGPEYVQVDVKKIPVKLTSENKEMYILVKSKLPAELRGTYARINVRAEADGGCHIEDGWLVKISE
jgi:hypothetical protein